MYDSDDLDEDALRERWLDLVTPFTSDFFGVHATWHALHACYTDTRRRYHNLGHIARMLDMLDGERDHAVHPEMLEFAIWFHDAIYDPQAKDNELRSAAWASRALAAMQVDPALGRQVEACILATQTHTHPGADVPDLPLILDLDVAILAAPEEDYDAYCRAIRHEYGRLDDAEYRAGRGAVLQRFADRPRLFFTPRLAARLERQARHNIARELQALGSS